MVGLGGLVWKSRNQVGPQSSHKFQNVLVNGSYRYQERSVGYDTPRNMMQEKLEKKRQM